MKTIKLNNKKIEIHERDGSVVLMFCDVKVDSKTGKSYEECYDCKMHFSSKTQLYRTILNSFKNRFEAWKLLTSLLSDKAAKYQ